MAIVLLKRSEAMYRKSVYLDSLEGAIIVRHVCKPRHRKKEFVDEKTKDGDLVWRGAVEVFDLDGCDEASVCYAWRHIEDDGQVKIFTVLGSHLIDSAQKAVQAAIFVDKQRIHSRTKRRGGGEERIAV